jgi:hypothetical protein
MARWLRRCSSLVWSAPSLAGDLRLPPPSFHGVVAGSRMRLHAATNWAGQQRRSREHSRDQPEQCNQAHPALAEIPLGIAGRTAGQALMDPC